MTTLRQAAQQALEACTDAVMGWQSLAPLSVRSAAIESLDALRDALAQEEQEPVAWLLTGGTDVYLASEFSPGSEHEHEWTPLFTHPPHRESRELTQEDIAKNLQSRHDAAKLLEERRQEVAQPRREWHSLTDEEIHLHTHHLEAAREYEAYTGNEYIVVEGASNFARAVERALKEKNNG
jgi:hypothetical protein